jgi:hypothetical protein
MEQLNDRRPYMALVILRQWLLPVVAAFDF